MLIRKIAIYQSHRFAPEPIFLLMYFDKNADYEIIFISYYEMICAIDTAIISFAVSMKLLQKQQENGGIIVNCSLWRRTERMLANYNFLFSSKIDERKEKIVGEVNVLMGHGIVYVCISCGVIG